MSLVKVRACIDADGLLTARLPKPVATGHVDVFVELPEAADSPNGIEAARDAREDNLLSLLDATYGCMPDIERYPQGEMPPPLEW